MDLHDSPEEAAFRDEVREFLAANLPAEPGKAWSAKLRDAGLASITWPVEYGGRGAPWNHQAIVLEEFARSGAPSHANPIALGMAGPTILAHGTEDHKRRYLPKILSAEEIWCQGFSEPGSGSDLASVRTRIEPHDGHFVVNGQKVWSTLAHLADLCILLGRSDPATTRQEGLTYVILDMHAPGVEVRPLRQITGEAEFNEIFFTDVVVPGENLLGEIGGGWRVAMTTLLHERGTLGISLAGILDNQVQRLVALVAERAGADPLVRDRVALEWIELQALKLTNYRSLATLMKTGIPGPEGSISKLHWSEQNQRVTKLAMEILGGKDDGYWGYQQLRSRGNTIEAGTSEILRSIVAERVLGLPRSR
ncbi:MAG TPA: acyl-CoA dehydrogenase family protein [Acidimicrobiales bacterium]|nr:acyl-CoA dehydrogenase family protein [Acidimicrobiales bacterium]